MAKKTEVARWTSIMAELDHKMNVEKLANSKKIRKAASKTKKEKK